MLSRGRPHGRQGRPPAAVTHAPRASRTTTGSTPGSPRSAVRYRSHRSPCGDSCRAHHPTFAGSMQV